MISSCDESVRFWINAHQLKDRDIWLPGWKTLNDLKKFSEK